MAITTYSELKTAVSNWLARSDLTDRIPEFIALAEARMSRALETRTQEKRATSTLTVGDAYVLLPSDLRSVRSVKLQTSPVEVLDYLSPEAIDSNYPTTGNGMPRAYTVIGGEIKFAPAPDDDYTVEITYLTGVPALSDAAPTNTLLTRYPDAYLYGALASAAVYLMDDPRVPQFEQLWTRALTEITTSEDAAKFGGTSLVMRLA